MSRFTRNLWCSYCQQWRAHTTADCRGGEAIKARVRASAREHCEDGEPVTTSDLADDLDLPIDAVAAALVDLRRSTAR